MHMCILTLGFDYKYIDSFKVFYYILRILMELSILNMF